MLFTSLADTPCDRTTDTPCDRTTDTPCERTTDTPCDRTTDTPCDRTTDTPYDRITDTPCDRITDTPYDRITDTPCSGQLYITDGGNYVVRKWNRNTNIVTTVGGTGVSGSLDADSPPLAATNAHFVSPNDACPDTFGNVYVADKVSNVVRKIDMNGVITRLIGTYGTAGATGNNGAAVSALLSSPYGVACDSSGNVYIADYSNGAIRMVSQANTNPIVYLYAGTMPTTTSILTTPMDGYVSTFTPMGNPVRPAIDMYDNLYVVDYTQKVVRVIYSGNNITDTTFASEAAGICTLIAAFPTLMSSGGWFCPSMLVNNPWCSNSNR